MHKLLLPHKCLPSSSFWLTVYSSIGLLSLEETRETHSLCAFWHYWEHRESKKDLKSYLQAHWRLGHSTGKGIFGRKHRSRFQAARAKTDKAAKTRATSGPRETLEGLVWCLLLRQQLWVVQCRTGTAFCWMWLQRWYLKKSVNSLSPSLSWCQRKQIVVPLSVLQGTISPDRPGRLHSTRCCLVL